MRSFYMLYHLQLKICYFSRDHPLFSGSQHLEDDALLLRRKLNLAIRKEL